MLKYPTMSEKPAGCELDIGTDVMMEYPAQSE